MIRRQHPQRFDRSTFVKLDAPRILHRANADADVTQVPFLARFTSPVVDQLVASDGDQPPNSRRFDLSRDHRTSRAFETLVREIFGKGSRTTPMQQVPVHLAHARLVELQQAVPLVCGGNTCAHVHTTNQSHQIQRPTKKKTVRSDFRQPFGASRLRAGTLPAKAYRLLRAVLSTAVEDSLIARNPCAVKGAGIERSPERPLPTGDEVWRLADAIAPRYRALVLTAGFVGLRWGELLGLQRDDVDLSVRVIHVRRSMIEVDGAHQIGPPKTQAGRRSVAIPPAVAVELAKHLENYVDEVPTAPVFVGPTGAALRRANWAPLWNTARVKVGRPDLTLHDLRHYASTLAAATGASTRELMARLGHASPAAALRYQHATAERDHVIAQRMDELIAPHIAELSRLRLVQGQ